MTVAKCCFSKAKAYRMKPMLSRAGTTAVTNTHPRMRKAKHKSNMRIRRSDFILCAAGIGGTLEFGGLEICSDDSSTTAMPR